MAGHCAALVNGVNDAVMVFDPIPVRSSFVP